MAILIGLVLVLVYILVIAFVLGLEYLIVSGLTYAICFAFGLSWSWLFAFGIFGIILLIQVALKFGFNINVKKD